MITTRFLPKLSVCLVSLLLSTSVLAANDDIRDLQDTGPMDEWRLIKNNEAKNIKAWDKKDIGRRYRSFKLDLVIDAPIDRVARAYLDVENFTHWFWEVKEAKLLKVVSDTEFYYYLVHRAPVTQPTRDVIIRAQIEPMTASKKYVILRLKAIPDYLPLRPPFIRMLAEDMTIKWTPTADNKTHFEVEGNIDPGGDMPVWAINAVQRQAPYYTVLGLQRRVTHRDVVNDTSPLPFTIRK